MNRLLILLLCCGLMSCASQQENQAQALLRDQLRNTYTNQNWFVPLHTAIQDLSIEQVNWKDSTDNHSIGELVSHIIFWNERILIAFEGGTVPDFDNDNEKTFIRYSGEAWTQNTSKLDSIQTQWETVISQASEEELLNWGKEVINMCSHIAYHTGQILYIRKQHGWWKSPGK